LIIIAAIITLNICREYSFDLLLPPSFQEPTNRQEAELLKTQVLHVLTYTKYPALRQEKSQPGIIRIAGIEA
jgi:hypothetical protein